MWSVACCGLALRATATPPPVRSTALPLLATRPAPPCRARPQLWAVVSGQARMDPSFFRRDLRLPRHRDVRLEEFSAW
jgi:hypothetical protein